MSRRYFASACMDWWILRYRLTSAYSVHACLSVQPTLLRFCSKATRRVKDFLPHREPCGNFATMDDTTKREAGRRRATVPGMSVDVAEVRRRREAGESWASIASGMGVSSGTVRYAWDRWVAGKPSRSSRHTPSSD